MHEYLKKAEENFDNNNYKKTIEYCDKLIEKGICLKDAYCLKAHSECYMSKNKDDKLLTDALKNIDYAIENDPEDDWSFFIKAFIFSRMKKYEEALVEINKAIHFHQHYYYYDTRGKINESLYREKEALCDYTLSIQMKETTDNYNSRGKVYFFLEEYQLARQDLQKAVELDDKNAAAWQNLGKTLYELDLLELSLSVYDTALKLEPENDFTYYLKSFPLKTLKDYKAALENINKAIKLDSEYSGYYRQRGYLYFDWTEENINSENMDLEKAFSFYANQKKSEKRVLLAEKDFKKAIEIDDENILNYWALLIVYTYRKDYKKQIEVIDKLEKLTPSDETIYSSRGLAKMKLGEYENAIFDFTKFLEFESASDNDIATTYGNRGVCYTQLEKYEEALSDFNITVEMSPSAQAYVNRGIVKVSLLGDKAAIEDYNEAIKFSPDSDMAYFHRGISQYNLKKYEESIADYFTAIDNTQTTNTEIDKEKYIERFYYSLKGLFEQKKYKRVINICNKILRAGFKHEKIYNCKGGAKIMLGKYEEAKKDCMEALKLNPDFEPAKINLWVIKQRMKYRG